MPTAADLGWVHDLATVDALVAAGVLRRTVRRRITVGRWSEPLPKVVCRTTGALTSDQRLTGAILYAGEGAVLSCGTAGSFWGYGPAPSRIHVTVTHGRHVRSTPMVLVHQTTRAARPRLVENWLVMPPARAAIDAAREFDDLDAARALLGRAVQSRRVAPGDLAAELDLAPTSGSLLARLALEEIALGAHAASEARLVRMIESSGLPRPEYNAAVVTALGTKYLDALWRELGKGVEVDGQRFHLGAASWNRDLQRQNAIQTAGVMLLRIPAWRLWREPGAVLADIRAFLKT